MFPRAKVDVVAIIIIFIKMFTIPAWVMLAVWFGVQLVSGYAMIGGESGVAYWAHAGASSPGWCLPSPCSCGAADLPSGASPKAIRRIPRWNMRPAASRRCAARA